MKAPTGRVARVAVVVSASAGMDRPNSFATAGRTKTRTKKSNASKVQPRNPAAIALRAFARVIAGGEARLAIYLLMKKTGHANRWPVPLVRMNRVVRPAYTRWVRNAPQRIDCIEPDANHRSAVGSGGSILRVQNLRDLIARVFEMRLGFAVGGFDDGGG